MSNELKKSIPTEELTLPETGQKVVFYKYLTTGESRQLQQLMLEGGQFDPKTGEIGDLPVSTLFKIQDTAANMLIKSVVVEDSVQDLSKDWLDALPVRDGNQIYAKIDQLTRDSMVTPEERKK